MKFEYYFNGNVSILSIFFDIFIYNFNETPLSIALKKSNNKIVNYLCQELKNEINTSPKFNRFIKNQGMKLQDLSEEQQKLITLAKDGKNVLVDACIGSGKTTAIQVLCDEFPQKKILYLTYNRLLKIDALSKINSKNAFVTNYHGFAKSILNMNNIKAGGVSDLIQNYIENKNKLHMNKYDLLLIDEYQDIDTEISHLLEHIKFLNPNIQIIAVGDMNQKIYDKTNLDVQIFIKQFLSKYEPLCFTKCFRLNEEYAKILGNIWHKEIVGVNNKCQVKCMTFDQIGPFLAKQNLSDILCLGSRNGVMTGIFNQLHTDHPYKFNKHTVYGSIQDEDKSKQFFDNNNIAIFTTYDSSKGLERKICVIFDFNTQYWAMRLNKNDSRYEIIRNIFCVAASRGKEQIIFVKEKGKYMLTKEIISMPHTYRYDYTQKFVISQMFDFKIKEDVEECFNLLQIENDENANIHALDINDKDGLIDLSPCIGILQEASFFNGYNIDAEIDFYLTSLSDEKKKKFKIKKNASLEEKVLLLVALETRHDRYKTEVNIPFVGEKTLSDIHKRMSEIFTPDEEVQINCSLHFFNNSHEQICNGICDVVKDDIVWELKFTSELKHEHYLQCACYMVALSKAKGVLWNVRTNERVFITIPNREKFMYSVIKTITKGKATNIELIFGDIDEEN